MFFKKSRPFVHYLISCRHKFFDAKSLTYLDFLSNAEIASFLYYSLYFLFIISSVTDCPTFICFGCC